jgi:hypothetical protein
VLACDDQNATQENEAKHDRNAVERDHQSNAERSQTDLQQNRLKAEIVRFHDEARHQQIGAKLFAEPVQAFVTFRRRPVCTSQLRKKLTLLKQRSKCDKQHCDVFFQRHADVRMSRIKGRNQVTNMRPAGFRRQSERQ